MAAVTGPQAIYSHRWRAGDVLIWDQRAILHRGTAWNFEEERTLASFVSSARESDGIASARPRTERN
jgi:alpha-ketoglutarate-dependent 2,4-dichlorophenoxyacetate dioxygenase